MKTQTLYEAAVYKKENWHVHIQEEQVYGVYIHEQRMWVFIYATGFDHDAFKIGRYWVLFTTGLCREVAHRLTKTWVKQPPAA